MHKELVSAWSKHSPYYNLCLLSWCLGKSKIGVIDISCSKYQYGNQYQNPDIKYRWIGSKTVNIRMQMDLCKRFQVKPEIVKAWYSKFLVLQIMYEGIYLAFKLWFISSFVKQQVSQEVSRKPAFGFWIFKIGKGCKKIKLNLRIVRWISGNTCNCIMLLSVYQQVFSHRIFWSKILCSNGLCPNNFPRGIESGILVSFDQGKGKHS